MTDRSDSESTAGNAPTEKKADEQELRGRYVEGTYGNAGVKRGRRAEDEEGQYVQGDYGAAGREGGLPEPLGAKAKESGRYVAADYGDAGAVAGRSAGSEIGQYAEGDYGADGTVGPLREARAGTSSELPATQNPQSGQEPATQDRSVSSGADAQADDSRSGADVGEAVDIAEAGTPAEGDHSHPERATTDEAPVTQVFSDPAMTEGQRIVTGSPTATGAIPPGPSPADAGSGGAQSVVGARESDRLAAGEPPAAGPPFDTAPEEERTTPPGDA